LPRYAPLLVYAFPRGIPEPRFRRKPPDIDFIVRERSPPIN
jgi:hypothetical protein